MSINKQLSDFIAKVTYKTTEEGGRTTAVYSGYKPHIKFPFSESMTSSIQNFIGKDIVSPGETVITEIQLLTTQYFENQITSKTEFELREGGRTVAIGLVLKILNDSLRK